MANSPYKTGYDKAVARKLEMAGYAQGSYDTKEAIASKKSAAAKKAGVAQWTRRYDALHGSAQPKTSDQKFRDVVASLQMAKVKLAATPRNPAAQGCRSQQAIMRDVSTILHNGTRR